MSDLPKKSSNQSWASWLRCQPQEDQAKYLDGLTQSERVEIENGAWWFWGRPNQQLPTDDWFVWLILAGRGWGKTRTAVENIAAMLRGSSPMTAPAGAPAVMSIIADTPFDMRQYVIEGPSGFLNTGRPEYRPVHEPSKKTLTWPNGCKALLFSAEDPETLRGASGSFFWWDELAKARYAEAGWMNMLFGMREGNPRGIVTTTPRPKQIIKDLVKGESTHITRGSTWDNQENLSPVFYEQVIKPLEGTRIGRQEIEAEILEEAAGALWNRAQIEATRAAVPKNIERVVVAVDPSGTDGSEGDEVGIVVSGRTADGRGVVLEDASMRASPQQWAAKVCELWRTWNADAVVAERNYGGEMVRAVILTADRNCPVRMVSASRGKHIRAEPVAALYEQERVIHAGTFPTLEDQMCAMTASGYHGTGSPDRLDAHVWAMTDLFIDAPAEPMVW
jgi:phage terminase large subunit-like protein